MKVRTRLALVLVGVAAVVPVCLGQETEPAPRFETDVDAVAVDANVVDSDGRPVRGLTAADFVVEVDGRRRRVLSADFIEFTVARASADPALSAPSAVQATVAPPRPEGRRVVTALPRGGRRRCCSPAGPTW